MVKGTKHRSGACSTFSMTLVALILWHCLALTDVRCQDPSVTLEYAGSTLWNRVSDVLVEGNLAYLAMRPGIRVVDLSDPSDLQTVAEFPVLGRVTGVSKVDEWLYVVTVDSGMVVLDSSDPRELRKVGSYPREWWWSGRVTTRDNMAFICREGGIELADISKRTSPEFISFVSLQGASYVIPNDICLKGNLAFVSGAYVWVVDFSDSLAPTVVSRIEARYHANGLELIDTILVVADGSISSPPDYSRISLYDATDPANPVYLGQFRRPGDVFDVSVSDGLAYVGTDDAGLLVLNLSDPESPLLVSQLATVEQVVQVVPYDDKLLLVEEYDTDVNAPPPDSTPSMYSVVEIGDPGAPKLLGSYPDPGSPIALTVGDRYGYVISNNRKTISVVDLRLSGSPTYLATLQLDLPGQFPMESVGVYGKYLFLAMGMEGIAVMDLADPLAPRRVGYLATPGWASKFAFSKGLVFLACGSAGVLVIEVDDTGSAHVEQTIPVEDWAADIVMSEDTAYVASRFGGLELFDVSDISNVRRISRYPDAAGDALYNRISKVGNYVCASGGGSVFDRIDISEPDKPRYAGRWKAEDLVRDMVFYSPYLAVAALTYGVQLFDVSDPDTVELVADFRVSGSPLDLAVVDSFLAVADGSSLLRLIKRGETPTPPDSGANGGLGELYPNYPNPFNGSTRISYSLFADTFVDLSIYNVVGQRIVTLVNEYQTRNRYHVDWHGLDVAGDEVPSGVYFCRLRTNGESTTKKIVVLR